MGTVKRRDAPARAMQLTIVVALTVVFTTLGLETDPQGEAPTELWASLAGSFVWVTVVWDGRSRPEPRVALHLAAQLAIFVSVASVFGWPLSDSLWMGVTNIAGGVLMAVVYARIHGGSGWAPATARANISLALSALLAGTVVVGLAGFPNLELGEFDRLALWWTVRNLAYAYIGGVTLVILFFGERRLVGTPPPWWAVVLLVPLGVACVAITYSDPEQSLTWFLLLPAVVAGSILTLRGAAGYSLFIAMLTAFAALHPINQFGYEGRFPGSIIIDLLLTACTFVTIHLAILLAQRAEATEQLEVQRHAAEQQAALLNAVFDAMSDGLIVQDAHGRVIVHNRAARRHLARPIPGHQDPDWAGRLKLRTLEGHVPTDKELPGGRDPGRSVTHLLIENDGSRRVLQFASSPLPDDTESTLVLFSDVTAERERLTELTGFAGVVAHDLRGPLTSLHGWLELAEDALRSPHPETALDLVSRATLGSARMQQVIEDWLAYTVQRDGLLTPSRVNLADLIEEVVAPYDAPGLAITPRFELAIEHSVRADRVLTKQLLANLIGNAVKYAGDGQGPQVSVRTSLDAEAGYVRIEISDRGIGLPPGEEERVFEEFHRAETQAEVVPGTGLGLPLCQRIVSRHGGSIHARNNPEGGATFSFTLPAA